MIVGYIFWKYIVPRCLVKQVGAGSQGRERKKWYVLWAMIWSRHIEGMHVSQDSLQHTKAEKCVLWALTGGKKL